MKKNSGQFPTYKSLLPVRRNPATSYPKAVSRYRWPGRNPHDRQSLARAFVAKALYRHPTTSDLIRALNSAENLRRICGFMTTGDIPSESTFSRAFAEFAASSRGNRVHDALVPTPLIPVCTVEYGDIYF